MTADPKPAPRIKDPGALARARLASQECASCGRPGTNAHHVIPKGAHHGDDVTANIVILCGSGSHGCHGALHGNPYVTDGIRWTQGAVREAVGRFIVRHRPDTVEYVLTKMGWSAGREFLRRTYMVALPADYAEPVAAQKGTT